MKRKIFRYINTIRYLKSRQVFYRFYYKYYTITAAVYSVLSLRSWPKYRLFPLHGSDSFQDSGALLILGESAHIDEQKLWNNPDRSKLWLYNLHYLDGLHSTSVGLPMTEYLMNKWVTENPPCRGTGWEPYPLSLRIVNIIKWLYNCGLSLKPEWAESLFQQAEALSRQIEHHILANHIFTNGKALVFAGTCLINRRADIWLKKGIKILDRQIQEQFLPDGAHFELSPMYHSIILWDMCDLLNLAYGSDCLELKRRASCWEKIIIRGLRWLQSMLHPDGKIAFFNDAAFGIAPDFENLKLYAGQLGLAAEGAVTDDLSFEWLKNSGYCIVNMGHQSKAIIDLARVGSDYQPGHAHADTLSFELSLFGQRFLVNSGTSQYGEGEQRDYERSSRAHNTVTINDENSSEVWAGFRVARRACPLNITVEKKAKTILVSASHDGYRRLAGRNIHQREWQFTADKLVLKDSISGACDNVCARFYLHPEVRVRMGRDNCLECRLSDDKLIIIKVSLSSQIRIEHTNWYPEFGVSRKNLCVVVKFSDNQSKVEIIW